MERKWTPEEDEEYIWGRRKKRRKLQHNPLGEDWGKEDDQGEIVEYNRIQEDRVNKVSTLGQDPVKDSRKMTLHDHHMEGRQWWFVEENAPDQELTLFALRGPGEIKFASWSTQAYASVKEPYESKRSKSFSVSLTLDVFTRL